MFPVVVSVSPSNVVDVLAWVFKEEEVALEVVITVSPSKVDALAPLEVRLSVPLSSVDAWVDV